MINENAINNRRKVLKNTDFNNDPEFKEIIDNFIFDEVENNSDAINLRTKTLIRLATLLTNQSPDLYRNFLEGALNILTAVEIKEVLYQSTAYIGLGKSYPFFRLTNEVFEDNGIELPVEGQSTTDSDSRYEKGLDVQVKYFGPQMKNARDGYKEGQKHFADFLADYCFGDYYTRTGLSDQDRELITFTFIVTLGGCENQLRGHVAGNLSVGNDEETLIAALTVIMPFIGFPRTLNALAIINEITDKQ